MTYSVNFANYTIGKDAYQQVTEVCSRFGTKALLIGGALALKAGKEKLLQAISAGDSKITIVDTVLFGSDCTYERMEELAAYAKSCGAEMIFGMGGGKALDTAKGTAEKAGLPVFTFPTIAATCAAITALSVVYREDGNFDSFYFYDKPARHSFIMPFLTDCGIMEFLGVLARPVVRPLFHVPGRASVDLIASWFGASNAAVILTREQYMKGYYTKREAGYIMTNFSLVSIPFCLMVADTMGIANLFPSFYLCICLLGIILAVIIARIPPIRLIPDTYRESVGKQINEDIPQEKGMLSYALEMSCRRAEKFTAKTVCEGGFEVMVGMFFDLIPIVVSWGTIALMIATYTPFFKWISYPMGMYLNALGVPEAFAAAPATLVGFTDMFIPALLSVGLASVKTKFVIGVLSLIQIIYLTEVGTIIIKSEIPLNFWKLLVIFLERTIIAIPLIVLFANIIGL